MFYRRAIAACCAALLLLATLSRVQAQPQVNPPDRYADAVAARYLVVNPDDALHAPDGRPAFLFGDRGLWLRLDMGAGEEATGELTLVVASSPPVITTVTLLDASGMVLLRQDIQLQESYNFQAVRVPYSGVPYRYVEIASSPFAALAIDAVIAAGCVTCPAAPTPDPTDAPTATPTATPLPSPTPTAVPAPTPEELTPLEAWLQGYGLSGPDAAPGADPDGDCAPNSLERERGSSPVAADSCVWLPLAARA